MTRTFNADNLNFARDTAALTWLKVRKARGYRLESKSDKAWHE